MIKVLAAEPRSKKKGVGTRRLKYWRYCVLGEGDLAAEPLYRSSESWRRSRQKYVFQTPRPHSFFLDRGSAAKTLITQYRQLRRLAIHRVDFFKLISICSGKTDQHQGPAVHTAVVVSFACTSSQSVPTATYGIQEL